MRGSMYSGEGGRRSMYCGGEWVDPCIMEVGG